MAIYQKICYKVEDFFVKMLSKKQESIVVREKVNSFRKNKRKA